MGSMVVIGRAHKRARMPAAKVVFSMRSFLVRERNGAGFVCVCVGTLFTVLCASIRTESRGEVAPSFREGPDQRTRNERTDGRTVGRTAPTAAAAAAEEAVDAQTTATTGADGDVGFFVCVFVCGHVYVRRREFLEQGGEIG